MVSVSNTVDINPVTDPALRFATKNAVEREGVEYQIASNSPTSSIYSPDTGDDRDHEEVVPTKYTLSFDLGDSSYGSIEPKRLAGGDTVRLPSSGPNVDREGWHIAGWTTDSAGLSPAADPFTMPAANTTLYAVWEENPVLPFEYPPAPLLFYMDALSGHRITTVNENGHQPSGYGNNSTRRTAIGNMTNLDLQYNEAYAPAKRAKPT